MKLKYIFLSIGIILTNLLVASDFETDTFKTSSNKDVVITFIKHGSLMLTYEGVHIQVDPVTMFADYSTFPKADFILITHEHGDHLDIKAIDNLTKDNTRLILNQSSRGIISKGDVMKNGDKLQLKEDIHLEASPAYNTTEGREKFHPRHRDNGYILTIDGLRIYIAGDTEDIPEMKDLKNIDIAFLPVNQPYTMTVDQSVNAAQMFSPKILYPYHFGDTDVNLIKTKLQNSGVEVRIRKME
ncbi:MAG: MBL fold metallo-hydrolase [Fermentimonas sp.]|nr:MBL fold metallo-hydrolase [Fermentimonas sp.]